MNQKKLKSPLWLVVGVLLIALVFGSLFLLSIKLHSESLPKVRLCYGNLTRAEKLKDELEDMIMAKEINSSWQHDTKYSILKGEPECKTFENTSKFFINKVVPVFNVIEKKY